MCEWRSLKVTVHYGGRRYDIELDYMVARKYIGSWERTRKGSGFDEVLVVEPPQWLVELLKQKNTSTGKSKVVDTAGDGVDIDGDEMPIPEPSLATEPETVPS
jgi:hypothetical protein